MFGIKFHSWPPFTRFFPALDIRELVECCRKSLCVLYTHTFHQELVGLQQYTATGAKQQTNLNTGFGWAKFKKQQKNDTTAWVNKWAIFSVLPQMFQIFESTESQGAIGTLQYPFGKNMNL